MRSFLVAAVVASASISGAAQAAEDISSGSGVAVGDRGEVLTNAHVVDACAQIIVRSPPGDSATAQLIARDEKNDLAVVRTRPLSSVATFRDGKPVRAGDAIVVLDIRSPDFWPQQPISRSVMLVTQAHCDGLAARAMIMRWGI